MALLLDSVLLLDACLHVALAKRVAEAIRRKDQSEL